MDAKTQYLDEVEAFAKLSLPAGKALESPALKTEIPSDLLKRHPGVRASEARLAAAM